MTTKHFSSKRDRWLVAVVLLSVVGILAAAASSASTGRWLFAVILAASAGGMLWIFFGTRYSVTDSDLIIRSGPLRWRIALNSITSVEPSRDPIAAPAS